MVKGELVHMPGTKLAPRVVLTQTLDNFEDVESVFVVIKRKNGRFNVDWSSTSFADFSYAVAMLDETFRTAMRGDLPKAVLEPDATA